MIPSPLRSRRALGVAALSVAVTLLPLPARAAAPTADQVMTDAGLSDSEKQQVLAGQFVTVDLKTLSDRDLSVGIAFVVGVAPDQLAREVEAGALMKADPQVKQVGRFSGPGSLADLSGLTIGGDEAALLGNASAGSSLNLATAEIAAFQSAQAGGQPAVQQQLRQMLLARYQAYHAQGLAGIAPYDRGGSQSDPAADLRKAADSTAGIRKYVPALQQLLANYPQGDRSGVTELQQWLEYDIDGTTTYVLSHGLVMAVGDARVVVQRQYYASTGYDAEQAVVAFLPSAQGTVVVYGNHTFTEQVAGFGGSAKRSIGRGIMTKKLEEMFRRQKAKVEH